MVEHGSVRQSWTVTRQYLDQAARDRDIASMAAHGWAARSMAVTPGRYKAGKGCFLFLIFAPLALLAGNDPDRWTVIYSTTIPPERGHLPPPLMGGHQIA
jgi:hypothetical protein